MCDRRRQPEADGGDLYITRACEDVWRGTGQLVYELIVLSFSLFLSLSLSLSLPPSLCGLSPLYLVSPSPCHSVLPSPFHSVSPSPCHSVLPSPCHSVLPSVPLGLAFVFRFAQIWFGLWVFELPLSPAVTL